MQSLPEDRKGWPALIAGSPASSGQCREVALRSKMIEFSKNVVAYRPAASWRRREV